MAIFTGKHVEIVGQTITLAAIVMMLHGGHLAGALTAESVYLLDRFRPGVFNWLHNFAEPTAWPGYVALGVAGLFAGHAGGWPAVAVLVGLFATGDGRLFDLLY